MDFLKKNAALFACGAAVLALVVFFVCFGAGASVTILGHTGSASVYDITFGDGMVGGVLVAWIFLLVGFLAAAFSAVSGLVLKNELYAALGGAGAFVFLLVSGILYFCAGPMCGNGVATGIGAIFCGILNILAALCAAVPCLTHFLKK